MRRLARKATWKFIEKSLRWNKIVFGRMFKKFLFNVDAFR